MSEPLEQELSSLPSAVQARLDHHRFDRRWFLEMAAALAKRDPDSNRVRGSVTPPAQGDVIDAPPAGSEEAARLEAIGLDALRRGEVAVVVLAGGMATRMGGVVKALVEAVAGRTFLEMRLQENRSMSKRVGRDVPLWLMTSHATDALTRAALGDRADGYRLATFTQQLSLRLTPEGQLFRDDTEAPSEHAPGHGDLPDALAHSDLLTQFIDRGGKVVMVANLDNLGASLDPVLVGLHLEHGKPVSCEVVDKVGSDRGGIPVRLEGRPVILEEFRLPADFDASSVRVFNTNTFLFSAGALGSLALDWTYFVVNKQVDGRKAIQFERLIGEVAEHLPTQFVRVPRDGAASRFLPVKDHDELAARREQLEAVGRSRGMLS